MAKNKNKSKYNIPDEYVVRVKQMDRIVDCVLALIFLGITIWAASYLFRTDVFEEPFQVAIRIVTIPMVGFLALYHYPKYIFEKVEVKGDTLTFYKLYRGKHTITFKDIEDIYLDGKDSNEGRSRNGSRAVIIEFGKIKYRLPCKFCDEWPILKDDLKRRGIAIRR